MKYKTYYKGSKVVWYNTDVLYTLNMTSAQDINIADYIRSMPEPTVSVDEDDFVTMTFEPIPENIASLIIEDDKLRFQVVRHKANSSHSKNIYFPYSFQFEKYINLAEEQNLRWGISIPNNGWQGAVFNVVTRPTISELTSGKIVRDMSGLFNNMRLCKCQTNYTRPWTAEYYFGFIYWKSFSSAPDTFKMGYYSRVEE